MLLINQNDYPDIPYPTNASDPTSSSYLNGTISSSGCGLCSLCMMVDQLTLNKLDLIQCRDLSLEHQANLKVGTNMKVLGPIVAQMYGLSFSQSDEMDDMLSCLGNGGKVIVNVGGDHDEHKGTFSHIGHYILLIGLKDGFVRILDPDYSPEKYQEADRPQKVTDDNGILYALPEVLHQDTLNRTPGYYLFNTKGVSE